MSFLEEKPELFKAINTLKARSFVYDRGSEKTIYEKLMEERDTVDEILDYDNCEMAVNTDLGVIKIHFKETNESESQNLLKARFNENEMKIYIACLNLYFEKYVALGAYIDTDINEIIACLEDIGLQLTKPGRSNKRLVADTLRKFDRCGILDYKIKNKTVVLKPGMTMAIDRDEFERANAYIIDSYKSKKEEETEEDEQ